MQRWRLQFLLLSAIWGSSFLFIKVLGEHWSALWVAFGRIGIGAITLVLLLRVRNERFPSGARLWLDCAVAALLFNAIPWTLFAYGEQHTSSIVAGLWNATTPLWVALLGLVVFRGERPTPAQTAGLLIGFLGVAILLGPWRGLGGGQAIGHLACGSAAFCYGLGFHYTRLRLAGRPESGVALSAAQLTCATALLAPFLALAPLPSLHIGLDGLGSLLALGALASGVGFALNYAIVRARGVTVASTVTYLIPVVSTVLGVVVLGETLHWNQAGGTLVLLLGIAVSQGRLRAVKPPAEAPSVPVGS
jgi:drug/metabolite transporter (DMT)-like permease